MSDSNEQHGTEISLVRTAVEEDVAKNSEDIIQQFDSEYQSHLIFLSLYDIILIYSLFVFKFAIIFRNDSFLH